MFASPRHYVFVPAWLVIAATISLAILAGGLVAVDKLPISVVVAVPIAAATFAVLRYPDLGLSMLPLAGMLVPVKIGTGSQSPLVADLLLAIVLFGLAMFRAIRASDWGSGAIVIWPTVALMCVWVVALLWSNVELEPLVTMWDTFPMAQLGGTAVTIVSCGVLLMAMRVGARGPWIQVAVWSLLAAATVAMIAYLVGNNNTVTWPFETGGLFTMWTVSLAWGQALFNAHLRRSLRVALAILALSWIVKAAIAQTWWFSGWLPSIIVLVIVLLLRSRKAFLLTLAAAGAVGAARFQQLYAVVWGTTVGKGDLTRLDIWQQSFDLFWRHPFLGTGPAGYAIYFQSLYAGSANSLSTHNNFMDVLMETGIVGAAIFGWFLIVLLIVGWRARSRWRGGFHGAFAQSAFAGMLAMLVAMCMGDWFIPFVYNQTIAGFRFTVHSWVFLGFMASLALIRPLPAQTAAEPATPALP